VKKSPAPARSIRDPHEVNLVAVSKLHPPECIAQALAAGHRLFGENRVQEAKAHWADLRAQYPNLKLHLIGPLQTNKAHDAVALTADGDGGYHLTMALNHFIMVL
jgi:PLP dependent protein